jgi:hypothetical protein
MPIYIASQGEHWFRNYRIEAEDLAGAKEIYENYLYGKDTKDSIVSIDDPEYIEDNVDDVVWYLDGEEVSLVDM